MNTIKDRYQLEVDTSQATRSLGGLKASLRNLGFLAAGAAAVQFGRQIVEATRQFETYNNQLKLITNSQEELESLTNRLSVAARNNRAAFGDTVDLFTKLTLATAELGISQERVLNVTGQFQKALAISGADAGTAAGAIRQFGQAMASGTVRGDEFNSIVEALGPALAIMAQESGLTVGKLRQMSQAGELTAETFFKLVEESTALSNAFNKTDETIGQLETALGDSFNRMLVKIGEVTYATQIYRQEVRDLARAFDYIARTELAPVNLSVEELVNFKDTGISAAAALQELNNRLEFVRITGEKLGFIFRWDAKEFENLAAAIKEVQDQIDGFDAATEAANEQSEALKAQRAALDAILEPHKKFIDQAAEFAKSDYRSELEKANQRLIDAEIVIEQLNIAFERSNGQIDNFVELLRGAQNELSAAKTEVEELTEEANKLNLSSFDKFFNSLIEGSRRSVEEQENAKSAQQQLRESYERGEFTLGVYTEANERLNSILGITAASTNDVAEANKRLQESIQKINESTEDRIQKAKDSAELDGLRGIQRELREIELNENRIAAAAKRRLTQQAADAGISVNAADLAAIDQASRNAIEIQQELAQQTYDNQRSFATGWKNAFEEYEEAATDSAKLAGDIFNRFSKGMEDSIVDFAKTGKFEMKDFLADIAEMILRAGIQRLIAQAFGLGSGGSSMPFAGGFANGGTIPSGQFGLVGENGPELISGPANITPIMSGGTTTVNYNINAVDAPSFQNLVARDPKFIFAVTEKGRQSVPQTRR
jgi:tape measure domain-containing protein